MSRASNETDEQSKAIPKNLNFSCFSIYMSFAEKWLRYLEEENFLILDVILISEQRERKYTQIWMGGGKITQYLSHQPKMKIPDKISFKPVAVRSVDIATDKYTFYITKEKNGKASMKIRYLNAGGEGIKPEEKEKIINKAKELGYKVKSFEITDV
jgi:hypothetical protein